NETGVVAGTAGRDMNGLDSGKNVFRSGTEGRVEKSRTCHPFLQGLRDGPRLLVDLLEHEVTILAALDGVGGQIAFADIARGGRAAGVHDLDGLTAHLGDVALLEKHE